MGSATMRERCCTVTSRWASPATPSPSSSVIASHDGFENLCAESRLTDNTTADIVCTMNAIIPVAFKWPMRVRLEGILLEAVTPGSRPGATRTTSSRNSRRQGLPKPTSFQATPDQCHLSVQQTPMAFNPRSWLSSQPPPRRRRLWPAALSTRTGTPFSHRCHNSARHATRTAHRSTIWMQRIRTRTSRNRRLDTDVTRPHVSRINSARKSA